MHYFLVSFGYKHSHLKSEISTQSGLGTRHRVEEFELCFHTDQIVVHTWSGQSLLVWDPGFDYGGGWLQLSLIKASHNDLLVHFSWNGKAVFIVLVAS